MNWKTLALAGVATSAMAMLGCGGGGGNDPDAPRPADTGSGGGAQTVTYIVSGITIPSSSDAAVQGFNLDGMVGGGCSTADDFTSPTGTTGVDNQLAAIKNVAGTMVDVDAAVSGALADGSLLLAMEVSDINDFTADTSVNITLFLVKPSSCTMDTCAPTGGTVTAGQMWTQRAAVIGTAPGMITGGRLTASVATLPLSFSYSGTAVALPLQRAQINAGISATGLTAGQLGGAIGWMDIDRLGMTLASGSWSGLRPLAMGFQDIGLASATTCDAVSAGMGFTAVSGTVTRM